MRYWKRYRGSKSREFRNDGNNYGNIPTLIGIRWRLRNLSEILRYISWLGLKTISQCRIELKEVHSIRELPSGPAIYSLLSGKGRDNSTLYVGETDNLRRRISQHLVKRDSSVTMEGSPVKIDPAYVKKVDWWEHQDFKDPIKRGGAELIAFGMLNPRLRSAGKVKNGSLKISKDKVFCERMSAVFNGSPSGRMDIMTLEEAVVLLFKLEERLAILENGKKKTI